MLIKINDIKILLKIGCVGLIVFIAHVILYCFFKRVLYAPDLLLIHPFLFGITVVAILGIKIIFRKAKLQMHGYAFLISSLFKMFLSVIFLFPVFQFDSLFRKEYVLQFFLIYFIYLIAEVYYLVQDFKNEKTKNL